MIIFLNTAEGKAFLIISAIIFGCITGSFLNVVVYRLPIMWQREIENHEAELRGAAEPHSGVFNLMLPGSICYSCKYPLKAIEKLPVISFIFLRGKCKNCSSPISVRYLVVEILSGIVAGVLAWQYGLSLFSLGFFLCLSLMMALSLIDIDTTYLPDSLTYTLLWTGLLVNVKSVYVPLHEAVIAAVLAYAGLYIFNFIYKFIRKKTPLGQGDLKLFAAIGAWFGIAVLPWTLVMASISCLLFGIYCEKVLKSPRVATPFGPFLAMSSVLVFFIQYYR